MDTVKLDGMTKEEACEVLDDMKVKIDIPHAAVMQRKRNEALDMAISALMDDWIPITKDMELPDHEVICCNDEEDVALGYLYFDEEENQVACDHDPYVMLGVVAYMEKPKPYKKEVNE